MDTSQAARPAPPQGGEDHWRWRPDWAAERACTFWYLTIPDGSVRLPALEEYVGALAGVPWLDAVPTRWWHLTLTEIGYADELDAGLLREVAAGVAEVVAGHRALRLGLGPVVRFRTALALAAGPDDGLRTLQAAVRQRTQEVLGADRPVMHPQRFRPHVSLAYVNRDVPGEDVDAVLAQAPAVDAGVTLDRVTLAAVTRQDRHYRWRVADEVRLA